MAMPPVELRAIHIFLVLTEELHFARTAERVGLTPSRVSQVIRRLERHAGGPLFERTSRQVRPTARGLQLRRDLAPAYAQIEDAFAATTLEPPSPATDSALPIRTVDRSAGQRAPSSPSSPSSLRPLVMGISGWTDDFQRRLVSTLALGATPRPVVTVPSDSTSTRVRGVVAGDLDLAFVRLADAPVEGLDYRALVTEPLLLAVPSDHHLASDPSEPAHVPLAALDAEPLAFYHRDQNPWWYDEVLGALAAAGAEPRIVHRGLWHFDVISRVRDGAAVALLSPSAAGTASLEGVVYRRLAPASLSISQGLVWRRDEEGEVGRLVDTLTGSLPPRSTL